MFYPLQKPTSRGPQAYLHDGKIVKGPYTKSKAIEIISKYDQMIELGDDRISAPVKVLINGPMSPILESDSTLKLARAYFLQFPVYGEIPENPTVETVETSYGKSSVISIQVQSAEIKELSLVQIQELVESAIVRYVCGIGDTALRNFLLYKDHIRQIDIDKNRNADDENFLRALFPRLNVKDKKILEGFCRDNEEVIRNFISSVLPKLQEDKLILSTKNLLSKLGKEEKINEKSTISEIKEKLDSMNIEYKKNYTKADLLSLFLTGKILKSSSSSSSRGSTPKIDFDSVKISSHFLDQNPSFCEFIETETFIKTRDDPMQTAGLFVAAFLALHNYCFYASGSGYSITSLATSIYTGLLEDLSVVDIYECGPIVVELMKKLEENYEDERLALNTAIEIYKMYSSAIKTREISFWRTASYNKDLNNCPHPFAETARSLQKEKITLTTIFGNTRKIPDRWKWLHFIMKTHTKIRPLGLYFKKYIETMGLPKQNSEKVKRYKGVVDIENIFEGDFPVPNTEFRKETTGIVDVNGVVLSRALCKSILQKAFRIGLYTSKIYGMPVLGNKLTFAVSEHYIDKHVHRKEGDEFIFFQCGMRSSNCGDIVVNNEDHVITLYQVAMIPYLRCKELNKPMKTSQIQKIAVTIEE